MIFPKYIFSFSKGNFLFPKSKIAGREWFRPFSHGF